jgi:hypothetical protein
MAARIKGLFSSSRHPGLASPYCGNWERHRRRESSTGVILVCCTLLGWRASTSLLFASAATEGAGSDAAKCCTPLTAASHLSLKIFFFFSQILRSHSQCCAKLERRVLSSFHLLVCRLQFDEPSALLVACTRCLHNRNLLECAPGYSGLLQCIRHLRGACFSVLENQSA